MNMNIITKILSNYNNYPANSLSKRDIIISLPYGDENFYSAINLSISNFVQSQFNSANLEKPEFSVLYQARATSELQTILQKQFSNYNNK